jgi:hypothetical protein
MSVGKFCEIALRLLQARVTGSHTAFGKRIDNFADDCRKLITTPAGTATESERTVIPRALVYLYTMRNKRGIGHLGGDVDANQIDVLTMGRVSDWVLCEFIRLYHGLSLEEAQDIIDGIAIRELPFIWEVAGKKRVLKEGLTVSDQLLLVLYSTKDGAVLIEDLCDWVEYSNPHVFRNQVVKKLHKKRLLEYDVDTATVLLSPKGAQYVEDNIL